MELIVWSLKNLVNAVEIAKTIASTIFIYQQRIESVVSTCRACNRPLSVNGFYRGYTAYGN